MGDEGKLGIGRLYNGSILQSPAGGAMEGGALRNPLRILPDKTTGGGNLTSPERMVGALGILGLG